VDYTVWLSEQTGKAYRLPSEAEWEYAARAGTETAYWWGDEIGVNWANFTDSGSQWSGKQTSPVGSFPANQFGLFDTTGNIWEWIQDHWHQNYRGAPEDGSAWGAENSYYRVVRGGSWYDRFDRARIANRINFDPDRRNFVLGFRVLCAAPILER
jgi:formylglycine-generating enzyme required for sulfatase activity